MFGTRTLGVAAGIAAAASVALAQTNPVHPRTTLWTFTYTDCNGVTVTAQWSCPNGFHGCYTPTFGPGGCIQRITTDCCANQIA